MAKKTTNFSQFNAAGQKYIKKKKPSAPGKPKQSAASGKQLTTRDKALKVKGGLPAQMRARRKRIDKI